MISEHFIVSIQGQMETSSISQHVLMCSTTKAAALQILSLSPAPGLKGMGVDRRRRHRQQLQGESRGGGGLPAWAAGPLPCPRLHQETLHLWCWPAPGPLETLAAPLPHSSGLTPAGVMLRKEGGLVEFPAHVHGCRQVINCQPGARVWLSA